MLFPFQSYSNGLILSNRLGTCGQAAMYETLHSPPPFWDRSTHVNVMAPSRELSLNLSRNVPGCWSLSRARSRSLLIKPMMHLDIKEISGDTLCFIHGLNFPFCYLTGEHIIKTYTFKMFNWHLKETSHL